MAFWYFHCQQKQKKLGASQRHGSRHGCNAKFSGDPDNGGFFA